MAFHIHVPPISQLICKFVSYFASNGGDEKIICATEVLLMWQMKWIVHSLNFTFYFSHAVGSFYFFLLWIACVHLSLLASEFFLWLLLIYWNINTVHLIPAIFMKKYSKLLLFDFMICFGIKSFSFSCGKSCCYFSLFSPFTFAHRNFKILKAVQYSHVFNADLVHLGFILMYGSNLISCT